MFIWPLPTRGTITSRFGARGGAHKGLDVHAARGTPILAAAPGRVIRSGPAGGYGNLVEIDHGGGYTTRYAHNDRNLAPVGARVNAGQPVALMGNTGNVRGATGVHLHFEIRRGGTAVNPLGYVSPGSTTPTEGAPPPPPQGAAQPITQLGGLAAGLEFDHHQISPTVQVRDPIETPMSDYPQPARGQELSPVQEFFQRAGERQEEMLEPLIAEKPEQKEQQVTPRETGVPTDVATAQRIKEETHRWDPMAIRESYRTWTGWRPGRTRQPEAEEEPEERQEDRRMRTGGGR